MTNRKELIKKKIKLQQVKNKSKQLIGVEILELFEMENDDKKEMSKAVSDYLNSTGTIFTSACSKLSFESSDLEIYSWIISKMRLENGQEYYFLLDGIWLRIKITDLQFAVKSLWNHNMEKRGLKEWGSVGFLLINKNLNYILETGSDSRDEYNYYIDIADFPL